MKQLKQIQAQFIISFFSPSSEIRHYRRFIELEISPNRFIYNTLIRAYSNKNSAMESVFLLRQMMKQGFFPNNFTFPFVLKSLAKNPTFGGFSAIHSLIIKTGFASQVVVMNALLHVYVAAGYVCVARKVFDEITQKSNVSWNSMIDGYSMVGDYVGAFLLFGEMRNYGLDPDEFTIASLLSVCSQSRNLENGRALHHFVVVNDIRDDLIVNNALIDMYGKCGEPVSARLCFDRMPARNVVSWTSLFRCYAQNGLLDLSRSCFEQMLERSVAAWNAMIDCFIRSDRFPEALDLYERMRSSGIAPNEITLIHILSACSHIGNFVVGEKTHGYIVQNIENPSLILLNSIVDMYAKCGHLDVASTIFNMIEKKNVVSWNIMIGALAAHGNALDAIELFRNMLSCEFLPDGITFVGVLNACSHGGLIELGRGYFEAMDVVYDIRREIEHYACMVDLFGRRGMIGGAIEFIRGMPMKPDAVIWGALLGACRIRGDLGTGLGVMKQILELEDYSSGLFVLLCNFFCEMGRWEDVMKVRKMMNCGGVKKVGGRSLIEIGGKIFEFFVEDFGDERSRKVYFFLDQLTYHLMCLTSFSDSLETLLHSEE